MDFISYFPVWEKLTAQQQQYIRQSVTLRSVREGTLLHGQSSECLGLLLIASGQLRAYIVSDQGREVTLYRLFERDLCLFSASCMMRSIQFDICIEAERDTQVWVIPPDVFQRLSQESAPVANYTNEIMSSRFSEVMWLIEQIMWKSFDKRLATFLIQECAVEGTHMLHITHERIANHLGSAREVVTRMLRYFQSEGMVRLSRGIVEITNAQKLENLQEEAS